MLRSVLIAAGLAASAFAEVKLPPPAATHVDFKTQVQPIFVAKCQGCHGAKQQQSGLRLDKRQNALRGGDYGPVIVPGKSAESKLILRLVNGDGGVQMPPTGALPDEEIGVLRAWIDQGAEFPDADLKAEEAKPVDPNVQAFIAAICANKITAAKQLLASHPEVLNGRDAGGATPLHHASAFGSLETMKLLLDAGAKIDAKSSAGATPLHWAVAAVEPTRLLIARGANVNAQSNDGRTPLYFAASQRNSLPVIRLLLSNGAKTDIPTLTRRTELMAAAGGVDAAVVRLLIEKGAPPKAASASGSTALHSAAAAGNLEIAEILIAKGADVNARTKRNESPLAAAAQQGSEPLVRLLLSKGAQVNVQDENGYTPLMYAAYSERMPAGIARLLLDKGAAIDVSGGGESPRSLAAKRGSTEVARLLGAAPFTAPAVPANANTSIPVAISRAFGLLEAQSHVFVKKSGCNSCHNQSLPTAALAIASEHGIRTPKEIVELPNEFVEKSPERVMAMQTGAINSLGYEMFARAARHAPADEYSAAVVYHLKAMQTADGNWLTTGVRPPLTSDDILTTAFSIRTLQTYGSNVEEPIARAAAWLRLQQPKNTQECAFRLLGLAWAGADATQAAAQLLRMQQDDGGWKQLPGMATDAYATGEALYALRAAGKLPASAPAVQKGVAYLLRTQSPEGAWHVYTRSFPLQPYFDTGFPYQHDQWISAAGTSWAIMALSLSQDAKLVSER